MTYPQDPRFGRSGGPAGPHPRPGFGGPSAQAPHQYAPPRYGQQPPQFGPAPFGPQAQFGPPNQFGYPPLPKKSRTGLIVGLTAVLAVVAVGGGLLIWQPWKSDADTGPHTETAMLDNSIALTVEVPEGWTLTSGPVDDKNVTMIVPESETRTPAQIDNDGESLADGGRGTQIHALIAQSGSCPRGESLQVGAWTQDSNNRSSHAKASRRGATTRVDDTNCVRVVGVDFAHSADDLSTEASELLPELVNEEKITAARAV
ncbi:hypothetical protein JVX90_16150 [Gordonia sp. PDNC005]|uniref:hypothetical protein n=1 Tax=unclassified Gordonia (in: high G+C Gram-positive bacteria) TaxID=2657482 RepID=UPI001964DE09|nr:hypothetical protein [Gordonia sp. PDNC005]QRY61918.1 hypothetical protein JVX90_16150 [Gordonia sp. PDNC005]